MTDLLKYYFVYGVFYSFALCFSASVLAFLLTASSNSFIAFYNKKQVHFTM